MLAGRNDVMFPSKFVKTIADYSDDGATFHGAYGFRWRHHFEIDQLRSVVAMLRENPQDRRIVMQMWDPKVDFARQGKDFPCNTNIYFRVRFLGTLDMTVCNRSNDAIWGLFGANCVHFSVLHEFVSRAAGLSQGVYYHFSNDLHYYPDKIKHSLYDLIGESSEIEKYRYPIPIILGKEHWDEILHEIGAFVENPYVASNSYFIRNVAAPMYEAWEDRRNKEEALSIILHKMAMCDWKIAAQCWIERNIK